jgi:hypothetical protein
VLIDCIEESTTIRMTSSLLFFALYLVQSWWQVDLEQDVAVKKIVIYNRNEGSSFLSYTVVSLLDKNDSVLRHYRLGDMSQTPVIDIQIADFDVVENVKQCRDGTELWTGQVKIAPGVSSYGRRSSGYAAGQWGQHDYIVKPNDDCIKPLQLETSRLGDEKLKWKFVNGTIESVSYPGMVIANSTGSGLVLSSSADASNTSWRRLNTQLLELNSAQAETYWNQKWTASFVAPGVNSTSLQDFIDEQGSQVCYDSNPAFSQSFDTFSRGLAINDAADEDQCRKIREKLGFDKDYPFDTEIRDNFHDHMVSSQIDHTSGIIIFTSFIIISLFFAFL